MGISIMFACLGYVNWLVDRGRLTPGVYSRGFLQVLGRGSYVVAFLFGCVAYDMARWARRALFTVR
jgi:hypothetical protein